MVPEFSAFLILHIPPSGMSKNNTRVEKTFTQSKEDFLRAAPPSGSVNLSAQRCVRLRGVERTTLA